jgi:hypothetical protein
LASNKWIDGKGCPGWIGQTTDHPRNGFAEEAKKVGQLAFPPAYFFRMGRWERKPEPGRRLDGEPHQSQLC